MPSNTTVTRNQSQTNKSTHYTSDSKSGNGLQSNSMQDSDLDKTPVLARNRVKKTARLSAANNKIGVSNLLSPPKVSFVDALSNLENGIEQQTDSFKKVLRLNNGLIFAYRTKKNRLKNKHEVFIGMENKSGNTLWV